MPASSVDARVVLKDDTDVRNEECWQKMDWLVSDADRHGIPTGDAVTVDTTKLAGPLVKASWYSPRDGSRTTIGKYGISGIRTFDPPGAAGNGNDWVLLLDSTTGG